MGGFEFQRGIAYIVIKAFKDFDGSAFEVGERLTFVSSSFFPYDDGHTYDFQERCMRLCGLDEPSISDRLEDYFRPAGVDEWSRQGELLPEPARTKPARLRKKKHRGDKA